MSESLRLFIAQHHLEVLVSGLVLYVLPALVHFAFRKAKALPKDSPWDKRLRRLMKFTLDTTNYEEAEKKLDEIVDDVTDTVADELKKKGK